MRGSSFRLDVLVAVALTVAGELELLLGPAADGSRAVSAAAIPVTTLSLAWRRRAPAVPVVAIAVAMLVQAPLDGMLVGQLVVPVVAVLVALYSAGRHLESPYAFAAAALAMAVVIATRIAFDPAVDELGDAATTAIAVPAPLLVGRWVRSQALLQRELEGRAARLRRDRERDARQAADEERVRIAGDLQAAVAGALGSILGQARAVDPWSDDAERSRALLAGIADTAREALADVRRVLGILRRREDPAVAVPDPSARPGRRRSLPLAGGPWPDRLLVAVLLAGAEVELALTTAGGELAVGAVTAVAIVAPLLLRRRRPVAAGLAVVAAIAVQSTLLRPESFLLFDTLAIIAAAYSIGAHAAGRRAVAGGVAVALAAAGHAAVFHPDAVPIALLGGAALPWTVGRVVRGQERLTRAVEQEAARAEHRRAREAQAAVTAERMRVARELHDAVAHNISVIAIQAAGAHGVVERDPARAAECLALIETVAGEALVELGRLAGAGDPEPPSLARVDALARRARDGGLPVDVRVEGEPARLPAGVDLAAFRIVQEALANASKHAGDARALVVVHYEPRALELEISDDGRGPAAGRTSNGSGHGLAGMRERVALYGGTIDAGGRPGGGFAVRARLPLGGA